MIVVVLIVNLLIAALDIQLGSAKLLRKNEMRTKSQNEIKDKSQNEIKDKSQNEIKDKSQNEIEEKSQNEIKEKSQNEIKEKSQNEMRAKSDATKQSGMREAITPEESCWDKELKEYVPAHYTGENCCYKKKIWAVCNKDKADCCQVENNGSPFWNCLAEEDLCPKLERLRRVKARTRRHHVRFQNILDQCKAAVEEVGGMSWHTALGILKNSDDLLFNLMPSKDLATSN